MAAQDYRYWLGLALRDAFLSGYAAAKENPIRPGADAWVDYEGSELVMSKLHEAS